MSSDLLAEIRAKRQSFADKKAGMKKAYKFKPGTTRIRILPSWRDATATERPFYHDFGQAFIKDLDGNLLAVIGDRKMTYGEPDAVRDLINLAQSDAPTDAQREHYKNMLARQSHLLNAAVLNDTAVDPNEPQLVQFSQNQLDQILGKMVKLLEGGEDPLSLEEGFDLEVERVGTTVKDTRYSYDFARRPSKINPAIMDRAIDLDGYIRSQFADTDRAINAIKSIAQGALLPAPDRQTDYTTGDTSLPWDNSKVEDADYTAVDDAQNVREPVRTNTVDVSMEDLNALLGDIK